jgi:hypothetical protein
MEEIDAKKMECRQGRLLVVTRVDIDASVGDKTRNTGEWKRSY